MLTKNDSKLLETKILHLKQLKRFQAISSDFKWFIKYSYNLHNSYTVTYITHITYITYIAHITYTTHIIYITRTIKLIFKVYKKN